MKNRIIFTALFVLYVFSLKATLISPPQNMGAMVDRSEVIIYGKVTSETGNLNEFKVIDAIKGQHSKGDRIIVEEWSKEVQGRQTVVSGDVDFRFDHNYLVFLSKMKNGNYKASLLSMSVYEEGIIEGQEILARTTAFQQLVFTTNAVDRRGFSSAFKTKSIIPYLRQLASNEATWSVDQPDVFVPTTISPDIDNITNEGYNSGDLNRGACPNTAPCHCTTLFGPAGANQTKFADNNWTVCVSSGASDDPTTTTEIADLQNAITAMGTMPGVNISYTGIDATCSMADWGGATDAGTATLNCAGGFGNDCNKVMVYFDDPFGEVPDVDANCIGVLGVGGHFAGGTHVDACGATWQTACNPYFVMNNFGSCMTADLPSQYSYTAVLVHEMLHSLGIGHHFDATAFTTTTAANNPCGAPGANNPAGAATGDITHDQNECSGIMNPVVCNANEANNAPNFGLTALDNSCTDWMYNITSASTCAISNVTLNVAATCSGNDQTFGICFDVVDGSGLYGIEINGVNVQNSAGATAGNVCVTVTVTGPAAASTLTVNVRDDAVFACVDATNLMVAVPTCPPDCATTCADAATNGCNVAVFPTNMFPATYAEIQAGGGESCTLAPVSDGGSMTQCFEYIHADATATSFTVLSGVSTFEADDVDGISECDFTIDAIDIFDMSAAGCAAAASTSGTLNSPVVGTTYTICVTATVVNTVDTEGTCMMDCFANSVTPEMIMCVGTPDATITQTNICSGDQLNVAFGGGCIVDPVFDGLGANADGMSGWAILLYSDGVGGFTNFPPGLTGSDLLAGGDANIIFWDVNTGACADYLGNIVANNTCDPIDVPIGVLNMDVVNFFISSGSTECPIVEIGTVTIQPAIQVPSLTDGSCTYIFDAGCPVTETITIISGASATATIIGDGTSTVSYMPAQGDPATTLTIEVTNGTVDGAGTACLASTFTLEIDAYQDASLTCPVGPFCDDDNTDYPVSASPPPCEIAFADIQITLAPDFFSSEAGFILYDNTGAVILDLSAGGIYPNGFFDPYTMGVLNDVIVLTDIAVSPCDPLGTYTVGGTTGISIEFTDAFGDGWNDIAAQGSVAAGTFSVDDVNGANVIPNTAFGAGASSGIIAFNVVIDMINETSAAFSGLSVPADTSLDPSGTPNDAMSTFNPATAGCGEHEILYTVTDENGCASTDNCFVDVYCYPTIVAGTPACNADGTYNVDITVGNLSTGWNAVLDGAVTALTFGTSAGTPASTMITADGAVTISNVPMGTDITVSLTGNEGCDPMPIMVTAPSCATCPVFTGVVANTAVIVDSACGATCTVSGGSITAAVNNCPATSTLQYSPDGTAGSWSGTIPAYGAGVTVFTACVCDSDGTIVSTPSSVATAPGTCTDPVDPMLTIVDNVCPATTGTISASGAGGVLTYYTGADAATALANATGDIGGVAVAPAYAVFPAIVNVCVTETDANGCVSNPVCGVTTPVLCVAPATSIAITDPCTCNNDSVVNDPHTFDEIVTIDGNPGDVWTITTSTGANGIVLTEMPIGSGDYVITFTHDDGIGYFMEVTNGSDILFTSNVCQYPDASFTVAGNYCDDDNTDYDLTTLVMENSTPVQPGVALNVMVNGVPTTMFNPSTLGAGSYPIVATYDGSGMGGNGTAGGNAADAYAGPTNLGQAVMPLESDCLDEFVGTLIITTCPSCSGSNGTLTIKTVPGTN